MSVFQVLQHAMNVGVVDKDKLHRVDLERMRLAAEEQTNFMCDSVGRMSLRPGTTYINQTPAGAKARLLQFIAGQSAAYMLELTANQLRIYFNDTILARQDVGSVITSGDFSAATGWTLASTAGQTTAVSGGLLNLTARAHGGKAIAKQQVTTTSPGLEHGIRIIVTRGPVQFRIGSTDGGDEYLSTTTLDTGVHSLAFTPAGSYWVQFDSILPRLITVDSVQIEAAGVVSLPTIWGVDDLKKMRRTQSLDVLYVAALGLKPQKIERRGDGASAGNGWSVVDYVTEDGPFLAAPSSTTRMTPSVLEGNGTLTSEAPFFKPGHVGALFRLYHDGQAIDTYLADDATFAGPLQITGVNEPDSNDRFFVYSISGTWAGTIRNQRSFDDDTVNFHDYRDKQSSTNVDITANVTNNINDDDEDNAIAYYRLGFPTGKYTSGEAHVVASYNGGGGFGICRVTGYTSSTSVNIEVLTPFQGTGATDNWLEGSWSSVRGFPAATAIDGGRLVWVGSDKYWASISDAYEGFAIDFVGDAAPIDRSIALGGRNEARWLLPLSVMIVGTDARIARAGASALEEAVTPDNITIRNIGLIGAATVDPAELRSNSALFVESSGQALYSIDFIEGKGAYVASEFSKLSSELFQSGVEEVVVQSRPDQRIHICTTTGDAISIVHEPDQNVTAFVPISTSYASDQIESQCILPGIGTIQDRVYRSVHRVVNGADVRFIEKVALDIEAYPTVTGGKVMDAGVNFGAGSSIVSAPHLIGREVVAWVDGAPVVDPLITDESMDNAKRITVDVNGNVQLPAVPLVGGFLGIPYRARWKSGRLAYGVGQSSPVLQSMSIQGIGLLLADYCRSGVRYGTQFDNSDHPLYSMPSVGPDQTIAPEVVVGPGPDEYPLPMDGKIGFDARVVIEARSPKPVGVLALLLGISR